MPEAVAAVVASCLAALDIWPGVLTQQNSVDTVGVVGYTCLIVNLLLSH